MSEITDWTTVGYLGRGSTATVSLAKSNSSADLIAVKSSPLSRSIPLQREQQILSSLNSPHIISYLGCHVSTSTFNLFLEYAPLGSLSDQKNRHVSSIPSRTREILCGLSYLHSIGIAHCDIKAQNILIGSDNKAKIADFGCAHFVNNGDVETRHIMGTPAFMAPEVARAEEHGLPADIWALGCTVIEMATGRPPWQEFSDPVTVLYRVGFCDEVPEVPKWISEEGKDFLSKCFRRDPKERWTAKQLLQHPFVVSGSDSDSNPMRRVSPKSVLDQGLWDSLTEEEDEVADDVEERIQQLVDGNWANWTWDGNWVTVRTDGGDFEERSSTALDETAGIEEDLPSSSLDYSVMERGEDCNSDLSCDSICDYLIVKQVMCYDCAFHLIFLLSLSRTYILKSSRSSIIVFI